MIVNVIACDTIKQQNITPTMRASSFVILLSIIVRENTVKNNAM